MIEPLEEVDEKPPSIIIDKKDTLSFMEGVLDRDLRSVDGLSGVLSVRGGSSSMVYYPFSSEFSARGRFVSLLLGTAKGMAR
jgi:hypothetical protein